MTVGAPIVPGTGKTLEELSEDTHRTYRLLLKGKAEDLSVYKIPVKYLYFNIKNGRYADRMIRIQAENKGVEIDPKSHLWKTKIQEMLLAKGKNADANDKTAAERLREDMVSRKVQLNPGVVADDGGVLDGNRRLAVILEQSWEHFDGVILPPNTSVEDKWRIEAGIQMGRPLIHAFSPVNELLKIREGLLLFKSLKSSGQDPAPAKSAEQLVAETLYGVDVVDVNESIERIKLIDEYLNFIGLPERYDQIGDRAERFKEALKIIRAAKGTWAPEDFGKLKVFLFHQIQVRNMDNWDLRKVYQAIGGDPKARGKKPTRLPNAEKHLKANLPTPAAVQELARVIAKAEDTNPIKSPNDGEEPKLDTTQREQNDALKSVGDDFLHIATEEKERSEPIKILKGILSSLELVEASKNKLSAPENHAPASKALKDIKSKVEALLSTMEQPAN